MTHPSDIARLRDDVARRYGLALRPSPCEIERFRDEVAALLPLMGSRAAAEAAAARAVFLLASTGEREGATLPMAA